MKFIWSLVALLLATPMSAAELFPVANTRYGAAQGEAFQCADPGFRATKVARVGAELLLNRIKPRCAPERCAPSDRKKSCREN